MQYTPFYPCHLDAQGQIVDFGGWALPVNYGSQLREHEIVRNHAGMFDVSHMVIIDIHGVESRQFLRYLICNDIAKLDGFPGKALYSAMLNHSAGVIDDLLVYLMPFGYRIVSNATTEVSVLSWIKQVATAFKIELFTRRDLAMLAIQGPQAIAQLAATKPDVAPKLKQLAPFMSFEHAGYFYARTGYTGEDGIEIILPKDGAVNLWQLLLSHEVAPCGLGARDTLRLEAGFNLSGHEMDESISPLSCGMNWIVDLTDSNRDFIGKKAYQLQQISAATPIQVGLILESGGILRQGQKVFWGDSHCGIITSGTFSPTLKTSIAIARVHQGDFTQAKVEIRGKFHPVKVVKLPFVRRGKILV
jgi:aminomethyltransferase